MRTFAGFALAGLALAVPGTVTAEVLTVEGVYAARQSGAVEVREIAVERFGGDVGEELAIALADRLEAVRLDREPYFTILAGQARRYGYSTGETAARDYGAATMRGTASGEILDIRDGTKKRTRCVRRDERKKCVEEKVEVYRCRKLAVRFDPSVRLIAREGGTLYAADDTLTRAQRYCDDDKSEPSANAMMQEMVDEFAVRVRYDLAPEYRRENVRIMESRKGLEREDSASFKDAVRLTKTDQAGACGQFEALLAANPDHGSLLFNAGLCAEREDRLEDAILLYERTLAGSNGRDYARAGLDRVTSRLRAERQLDRRYPPDSPVEAAN